MKILSEIRNDSLLKFGGMLFALTVVTNLFNYFFQVVMGRVLGPADYSILAVILSLFYLLQIPTSTIQLTLMRFSSELKAQNRHSDIVALILHSAKNIMLYGAAGLVVILALSGPIAGFLNMQSSLPIIIVGLVFVVSSMLPITLGVLQGLQNFKNFGIMNALSAGIKFFSGISLVMVGLGVYGALLGYLLGPLAAFIVSLFIVLPYIRGSSLSAGGNGRKMGDYASLVLVAMFSVVMISNVDVILVKHFFPDVDAGYYASASILAKVIWFAVSALTAIMAAKVAESGALGRSTSRVLRKSFLYACAISASGVAAYLVAPYFIVSTLFGGRFAGTVPLLGLFSIAIAFFSLIDMLVTYNVSLNKFRFLPLVASAMILEIALIFLFHSSLVQVLETVTATTGLLFGALFAMNRKEILG